MHNFWITEQMKHTSKLKTSFYLDSQEITWLFKNYYYYAYIQIIYFKTLHLTFCKLYVELKCSAIAVSLISFFTALLVPPVCWIWLSLKNRKIYFIWWVANQYEQVKVCSFNKNASSALPAVNRDIKSSVTLVLWLDWNFCFDQRC